MLVGLIISWCCTDGAWSVQTVLQGQHCSLQQLVTIKQLSAAVCSWDTLQHCSTRSQPPWSYYINCSATDWLGPCVILSILSFLKLTFSINFKNGILGKCSLSKWEQCLQMRIQCVANICANNALHYFEVYWLVAGVLTTVQWLPVNYGQRFSHCALCDVAACYCCIWYYCLAGGFPSVHLVVLLPVTVSYNIIVWLVTFPLCTWWCCCCLLLLHMILLFGWRFSHCALGGVAACYCCI